MFVDFSKYDWVLNMRRDEIMDIPGFRECQVSAYASVAQGSKYT